MGKTKSRRSFLGNSLKAASSLALLGATDVVHAITSDTSPFTGYNPFAPLKSDLRIDPFGKHIQVSGQIYDHKGLNTLKDAQVEVWHLSPNSERYRHRSRLYTDASGHYSFITDLPNRELGKHHKIYFKVSDKGKSYFTELSFNNTGAFISDKHWEKNHQLGEKKLFPQLKTFVNQSNITFNISLNNN